MFCKNCGKEIADDSKFCSFCGTSTESDNSAEQFAIWTKNRELINIGMTIPEIEEKETDNPKKIEEKRKKHVCPSCGGGNLKIERQKFEQKDGCIFVILMLFCVFIFPPLLLVPALVLAYKLISPGKKVYVCQNCGNEWDVENDERRPVKQVVENVEKKSVEEAKEELSAKEHFYFIIVWTVVCFVVGYVFWVTYWLLV